MMIESLTDRQLKFSDPFFFSPYLFCFFPFFCFVSLLHLCYRCRHKMFNVDSICDYFSLNVQWHSQQELIDWLIIYRFPNYYVIDGVWIKCDCCMLVCVWVVCVCVFLAVAFVSVFGRWKNVGSDSNAIS